MASRADMVELCIAVIDSINGEQAPDFVREFTAERNYMPTLDMTGLEVRVFGMPVSNSIELNSREVTTQEDIGIQIGVMSKVGVTSGQINTEEMDDLVLLVEQIKDHVTDATDLLFGGSVALIEITHEPIWDHELLTNQHEFRSAPIFIFRCSRNRNP